MEKEINGEGAVLVSAPAFRPGKRRFILGSGEPEGAITFRLKGGEFSAAEQKRLQGACHLFLI
jgi:hypothetical protein